MNVEDRLVTELKKFTKSTFDVDNILSSANELKYKREIQQLIDAEYNDPSDEFVRLLTKQVYSGMLRQSVVEEFAEIVKQAFRGFLNDKIASRLQTAIESETSTQETKVVEPEDATSSSEEDNNSIETTQEEMDGYYIVKAILREIVDAERIIIRDVRSYCGILLDDNNRQPICRLHFNRSQKYIGLFGEDKSEDRVPIAKLDDIYKHADRLKKTVGYYINE